MSYEKRKPLYEPPISRNLSDFNANGQYKPEAICQNGNSPISFTCADGGNPTQPDSCAPTGLLPTYGRCTNGGNAVEGCFAGSSVSDCVSGAVFT